MTSEELFDKLYDLTDDKPTQIEVSGRWMCLLNPLIPYSRRAKIASDIGMPFFTILKEDSNSCAKSCYAMLNAFDTECNKPYVGILHMTVNDDLAGESKFSFMLCLKVHKDDKGWKTSFAIPASSIEILSSK